MAPDPPSSSPVRQSQVVSRLCQKSGYLDLTKLVLNEISLHVMLICDAIADSPPPPMIWEEFVWTCHSSCLTARLSLFGLNLTQAVNCTPWAHQITPMTDIRRESNSNVLSAHAKSVPSRLVLFKLKSKSQLIVFLRLSPFLVYYYYLGQFIQELSW